MKLMKLDKKLLNHDDLGNDVIKLKSFCSQNKCISIVNWKVFINKDAIIKKSVVL